MAKEVTKEEINEIAKIVDRYIILNQGINTWRDLAKKIKESFKGREKQDVALIMLGYKMGIEQHSKQMARNLESLLPHAKDILNKADKLFGDDH